MELKQITIRSSPFQFLKRLIIIEFFFAILPFFAAGMINVLFRVVSDTYETLPFSSSLSFNLFSVIIFTTVQVLIVSMTFLAWYFPVYVITPKEIIRRKIKYFGDILLINNENIGSVNIKQGWLAKFFNYGNLEIINLANEVQTKLRDVQEPHKTREDIEKFLGLVVSRNLALQPKSVGELIVEGEHQYVEFKSSFAWDYHQQRANKSLHEAVLKTIVAFLNSSGGYLLIGVNDDGKVLGLVNDFQTLRKPNIDGFEISFNMAFNQMIGADFRHFVEVTFPEIENQEICLIKVKPSHQPVYLHDKSSEKFYIRAGNASQALTISQSNRYIKQHFS